MQNIKSLPQLMDHFKDEQTCIKHYEMMRWHSPETGLANDGTKYNKKKTVIGIIERGGKVVLKFVPDRSESSLVPVIDKYVEAGSRIMTDEHTSYHKLNLKYEHETVNHSIKLYVDGDKHTNTIENFWSGLKRGIYGIYHQVSDKHMDRYLNEFAARFNARHNSPFKNFNEFLSKSEGGILYKNLILD